MDTKETSFFIAALIVTTTVGAIIIYFVISILRQQRRNLQLSRRNILAEITALENERARITNDLHDEISPTLSVIKFQINSLKVADEEDQLQARLAAAHLDNLIEKIRHISYNLMPNSLARKGLWFSMDEFFRDIQEASKIKINTQYHFPKNPPALSQEESLNIFRLLQEVIHNGIKHARATELQVRVSQKNNVLNILYKDNGIGFDYEKTLLEGTGFGLRSIKSRIEILNGKMSTETIKKLGTAYLFEIPIN